MGRGEGEIGVGGGRGGGEDKSNKKCNSRYLHILQASPPESEGR